MNAASGPLRTRFERRERIRFGHCDPAAIVFCPQYVVLFNGLVEDWVNERLGIGYGELIGVRRIGMPAVSLNTQFRVISRMGDADRLGLDIEHLGMRSIALALGCRGADDALRVAARKILVTTSLDTHRTVLVPDDLRAAIQQFAGLD